MESNKRISIITVCYNEPDVIDTCESIVSQTYTDFEWIVIDGGSNPETLNVFEKYKDKIDYFVSEKDSGIYNAMNKAIKIAKGEWLIFMNAGDFFAEYDILEKIFKNKTYNSDILYGNAISISEKGEQFITFPNNINKEHFYNSGINHQSTFIKKNLFDKYGLYDESLKVVSDWKKWVEFASNNTVFEHIDYFVAKCRLNGVSVNAHKKHKAERSKVLSELYTPQEKKKFSNRYNLFLSTKILGIIPFIEVKKKKYNENYLVTFFKIPVYKGKALI